MLRTLSILTAAFLIVSPSAGRAAEDSNADLFGLAGRVDRAVAEAAAFRASDRYEAAGRVLDAFTSAEPTSSAPYVRLALSGANYALGVALFQVNEFSGAVDRLVISDRLDTANVKILYALGNAYRRAGMLPEAVRHLEQVIALEADFGSAHFNLGNAYYAMREYRLAGEAFAESLQLDPNHVASLYMAGRVSWRRGRAREAVAAWRRVLELDPDHEKARAGMMEVAAWLSG